MQYFTRIMWKTYVGVFQLDFSSTKRVISLSESMQGFVLFNLVCSNGVTNLRNLSLSYDYELLL